MGPDPFPQISIKTAKDIMAKPKAESTWTAELARVNIYKRSQGKLARQLTAVAIAGILILGAWTLSQGPLSTYSEPVRVGIPFVISAFAIWFAFRIVNWPRFADFLISVEAEMDKVTWASREELQRATIVVICTMTFIGLVLFVYDLFWVWFFTLVRILQPVV
jgi:preprotein translocase subunit SecE